MGLGRCTGLYALVLLAVCCMPILAADYDEYYNGKRIGSEYCSRMPDRGGQVYTAVYKPGKEDKLQFAAIGGEYAAAGRLSTTLRLPET